MKEDIYKTLRPNVLIIQTDQQALWSIGCYGGKLVETPYIDRIADEGVLFEECYTPSAVCTPSRGAFVTGRYPHTNGAYRNGVAMKMDEHTLGHAFSEAGYHTGYIGKWHLDGPIYPGFIQEGHNMGFMDYRYMFNSSHDKKVMVEEDGTIRFTMDEDGDQESYMTDFLTHRAIDYMKTHVHEPFMLMLSIPDPHSPYTVREPYKSLFDPAQMPIPDNFSQGNLPDWAEQDEWGRENDRYAFSVTDRVGLLRSDKANYLGEVKCIDDNIGKLLDTLETLELLDNTLIVFTSDHGDYMGEHGLTGKNNIYDSVYKVPLLMRWPEGIKPKQKIGEYVTIVDFKQTLLGMLNIPCRGNEQGRDASCLCIESKHVEKEGWVNEVYIHPNDVPRAGIITPEYELAYVGFGWERDFEFEDHVLFDRIGDPQQERNLFQEPDYQDIIQELTEKIVVHHKQYGPEKADLPRVLASHM